MKNPLKILFIPICLVFLCQSCFEKVNTDLILSNVNIINVENGDVEAKMDIVIVGDKIHAVVPGSQNSNFISNQIIDCSDKFILPGLWDMHVHLSMIGEESIPLFVINGVTGVRDMGGNWPELEKFREKGNLTGQTSYPKIKTAGPILESPAFYNLLKQIFGSEYIKNRIPVYSDDHARMMVDSLIEMEVDLIKVRTVKSPEIFKAIAEACQKSNIPFTGHIDQNIGIEFAVENGIETIEHDLFLQVLKMDEETLNNTLESVEKSKPGFTPTLLATYNSRLRSKEELNEFASDTLNQKFSARKYLSPALIENWDIQLKIQVLESPMNWDSLIVPLHEFAKSLAGRSTVLAGTDCGVPGIIPGEGLHEEMIRMTNQLDLSNLQVLQAATINAARYIELDSLYGLIKPAYQADLLLLNSNPLDRIENSSDIFAVVKNGVLIDQKEKEVQLKKVSDEVKSANLSYETSTLNYLNIVLKSMGAQ